MKLFYNEKFNNDCENSEVFKKWSIPHNTNMQKLTRTKLYRVKHYLEHFEKRERVDYEE